MPIADLIALARPLASAVPIIAFVVFGTQRVRSCFLLLASRFFARVFVTAGTHLHLHLRLFYLLIFDANEHLLTPVPSRRIS